MVDLARTAGIRLSVRLDPTVDLGVCAYQGLVRSDMHGVKPLRPGNYTSDDLPLILRTRWHGEVALQIDALLTLLEVLRKGYPERLSPLRTQVAEELAIHRPDIIGDPGHVRP